MGGFLRYPQFQRLAVGQAIFHHGPECKFLSALFAFVVRSRWKERRINRGKTERSRKGEAVLAAATGKERGAEKGAAATGKERGEKHRSGMSSSLREKTVSGKRPRLRCQNTRYAAAEWSAWLSTAAATVCGGLLGLYLRLPELLESLGLLG